MDTARQYIKQFMSESQEDAKQEGTMDRGRIDFDTLGGNVEVYISLWDDEQIIGLNSASRGSIDFVKRAPIEGGETAENVRIKEKELREAVTAFMKEAVDEFDAKVIAKMQELGFELRG